MKDARKRLGDEGEAFAAVFLKNKGFKILSIQHRTPFGEIDLVCEHHGEIVFVEVKSRRSAQFGYPEEAVTTKKFQNMLGSAHHCITEKGWVDRPWRMDVIAIEFNQTPPKITHIEGIDAPQNPW